MLDNTYLRYLLKTFRDQLPFNDVPIKLHVRHRNREEREDVEAVPESPKKASAPKTQKRQKKESPSGSELWQDL